VTVRRLGVGSALLGLALAAWVVVVAQTRGMDGGPTTDLGGLGWYVGLWVTMTAAMMLPSAAPVVLLVDRIAPRATPAFVVGYIAAWTAAGLAAFGLVSIAVAAGAGDWRLTGQLVVAAGLYQLTPLKHACLRHCRTPMAFLRARGGHSPLRTGLEHGLYCIGCCAGLMVLLFALGVMSLLWMAVVAALIAAEKLAPFGDRLATPIALGLVAAGAWIVLI
jgi:predicted metal-binding membrane protein